MMNIGMRVSLRWAKKIFGSTYLRIQPNDLWKNSSNSFFDRLRDEQKFDGLDELKAQLNKDKLSALAILAK